MKKLFVLFAPVIMLCAAQPPAKKAPAAAKAAPARVEIPAGAVEFEPGAFRYTDTAGKNWIFRKTPFGIGKYEDNPAAARTAAPEPDYSDVKAMDAGDSVRFERPTPFGVSKWQTKKSDLDAMERAVWQRELARSAQTK